MIIAITNESTVALDSDLYNIAKAIQHQLRYHFCPAWGLGVPSVIAIPKGSTPPVTDVLMHVKDTSDQPGALGYHDDDTVIEGFAFAKTDQQYGASLSVTLSHEILELTGDRDCQEAKQNLQNGYFYAVEVGDPVEADNDGYHITVTDQHGQSVDVLVSNFILPAWYRSGSSGPFDHQKLLTKPYGVRPGGYVSYWKGTGQWTQLQAQHAATADCRSEQEFHDRGFTVVESKSPRQRVRGEL